MVQSWALACPEACQDSLAALAPDKAEGSNVKGKRRRLAVGAKCGEKLLLHGRKKRRLNDMDDRPRAADVGMDTYR